MLSSTAKPILLILGSHRSGTSLVAQLFSVLGFDLGRTLMLPSFDNPRGFWENRKIVEVHDQLLKSFNRNWTTATFLPKEWVSSPQALVALKELQNILKSDFNSDDTILVKDPRLSALLPLWKVLASMQGRPLYTLVVLRSPDAIAESLNLRNGIKIKDARFLALAYINSAVKLVSSDSNTILAYEQLVTTPPDRVIKLLSDIAPAKCLVENFNLENLIAQIVKPNSRKISRVLERQDIYSRMIQRENAKIDISHVKVFLKKTFTEKIFDEQFAKVRNGISLLPPSQSEVKIPSFLYDKLQSNLRSVEGLNGAIEERNDRIKALQAELSESQKNHAAMADGVKERDKSLSVLQKTIEKLERTSAGFEGGVKERNDRIKALQAELSESQKNHAAMADGVKERDKQLSGRKEEVEQLNVTIERLEKSRRLRNLTDDLHLAKIEMIEKELENQRYYYSTQLNFYQKSPFTAFSKRFLFNCLRSIRRVMPISEARKVNLTRRFTGVARSLQPPIVSREVLETGVAPGELKIDFSFQNMEQPIISVIVPVYNEIVQTIACLQAISQQRINVPYEVIVADDKSPDPFHKILERVDGLRYFRNSENLHFLRNCNQNAVHARGQYLVFLNNDTIVKPGWLQSLYDTFLEHGNVGVVGSKLIYPDGKLQEAGGILWEDASGWNWGKGQNASHPLYNFVRDVDFVSGASLMIPTELWREIGGFSESLEKAYYEDADLCFRVRKMGHRVLYQPSSEVTHIEGLSSGTDLTQGAKRYQVINHKTFFDDWKDTLKSHLPNGTTPLVASDRLVKGHVLYIDATTPEPKNDAGSVNAAYSMRALIELGYRVHFIPGSNFAHWGDATKELQSIGVECIYHPFYSNMKSFLKERGDMFEYIIVSRAECADLFLPSLLKHCPNAKIIYNTVDLHFMRMEREAKTFNDNEILAAAKSMRKKEISFMKKSHATIVLSEVESTLLKKQRAIADKLYTIPLIRPESKRLVEFRKTKDIVFIGGYKHAPNVDAVNWLVTEVWPEIQKVLPSVKLHICGSSMPEEFQKYASESVILKGFISDLDALLAKTRLTIAPLRYGAGLKGKVASSIGAGVPCVGTDIAFEGMAESGLGVIRQQAQTPRTLARLVQKIYLDEELWTKISLSGVDYHNKNYAYKNVSHLFEQMFEGLN